MSSKSKTFQPALSLVKLFLVFIIIGALALKFLPGTTVEPISMVDALFTATSAVCVTGLVVETTGEFFTLFGQIIILFLIQVGALGYMALASLLVLILGGGISIKDKILVRQHMAGSKNIGFSSFILRVMGITFTVQLIGATILTWRIRPMFDSFRESLFYGIFHSVSAFSNAGFDLFETGQSLTGLNNDPVVVITVALLIIVGGIGYIVINDILEYIKAYSLKGKHKFNIHTKIAITSTFCLLAGGTVVYFLAEYGNPNTMAGMPIFKKGLMAFFQSVTPRTAGFNMIDTGGLTDFSILFTLAFMFIGASPGGTGGGIKTTTFVVLMSNIKAIIKEKRDLVLFKRRITVDTVKKSVTIFTLSVIFIICISMLVSVFDSFSIKDILFEVTSAFGTVGLSTGITGSLSDFSKLFIIFTMFFGRLGPLTIFSVIIQKAKRKKYRYPEQEIAVG